MERLASYQRGVCTHLLPFVLSNWSDDGFNLFRVEKHPSFPVEIEFEGLWFAILE